MEGGGGKGWAGRGFGVERALSGFCKTWWISLDFGGLHKLSSLCQGKSVLRVRLRVSYSDYILPVYRIPFENYAICYFTLAFEVNAKPSD